MSDVLIKLNGLPTPLACDLPHAREFVLNGWPNSVHGFWSAEVESVWGSPRGCGLPMSKRNKHRADSGCVEVSREVIRSAPPCLADMAALGGPERSLGLIEEMAGDLERIGAGSNGVCTE
jgi:hypothetical protein